MDLIAAFYGCLYCGCVPVTVRPPHPQNLATTLPTVKMIVEVPAHCGLARRACPGAGGGLCGPPRPLCQALRPCSHRQPRALQVSKSACVLTTQAIMRLLKSKDAAAAVDVRTWPTILDTGAHPRLHRCVCWPPGHTAFPFFVVRIVLLPLDNKSGVRAADSC